MIINKRGQISEGLTWVVATIIIVIMLVFSIFVTSFYVSGKKDVGSETFGDFHTQKSLMSYLLTKQGSGTVYSNVKAAENLDSFNGNLAVKIFKGLYEIEYSQIWIGVSVFGEGFFGTSLNGIENSFFGRRPSSTVSGPMGSVAYKDTYYSTLFLKNDTEQKFVEGVFAKKG